MEQKLKILCVEDEPLLLEDLTEELEDAGYQAETATNGIEAIKCLQSGCPDLILCDMMMPELDGPGLLQHVRREYRELDTVPFIFLTAKATREDIIAGKRMGVDDYLTKPIDYDLLLATVESRLREVKRIEDMNQARLQAVENQLMGLQVNRGTVRVAMVTNNIQLVAPINTALLDLGCEVRTVREDALKGNGFAPQQDEIIFLVYSQPVHFYLEDLKGRKPDEKVAKYVVLAAPNMHGGIREAIMDCGIDEIIEYPYKPVDIFKQIVLHLRGPHADVKTALLI